MRSSLDIQYGRGCTVAPLSERRLRAIVRASLDRPMGLTLRFAPRAEALALNQRFRGRDYDPNVLTFEYPGADLGDIVICTPVVRAEAREQRKAYAEHLAHMVVHGVLHAQGWRHDRPAEAKRMERHEAAILAGFGIPDPYIARR